MILCHWAKSSALKHWSLVSLTLRRQDCTGHSLIMCSIVRTPRSQPHDRLGASTYICNKFLWVSEYFLQSSKVHVMYWWRIIVSNYMHLMPTAIMYWVTTGNQMFLKRIVLGLQGWESGQETRHWPWNSIQFQYLWSSGLLSNSRYVPKKSNSMFWGHPMAPKISWFENLSFPCGYTLAHWLNWRRQSR